jgi:hypothetical protein
VVSAAKDRRVPFRPRLSPTRVGGDLPRVQQDPADQQPGARRPPVRAVLRDRDLRAVHVNGVLPVLLGDPGQQPPQRRDPLGADREGDALVVGSAGQLPGEVPGVGAQRHPARLPGSPRQADLAAFMADSQVPWGLDAPAGQVTDPAWRTKPSWYMVTTQDRMIPPAAQRAMSRRAGSDVVEVAGSHAIYVSQPAAVADLIKQAATAVSIRQ